MFFYFILFLLCFFLSVRLLLYPFYEFIREVFSLKVFPVVLIFLHLCRLFTFSFDVTSTTIYGVNDVNLSSCYGSQLFLYLFSHI